MNKPTQIQAGERTQEIEMPLSEAIIQSYFAEIPAPELTQLADAAPELLQALRDLAGEIHLGKLNVRKDFSLMVAHAGAIKAIRKAEGK